MSLRIAGRRPVYVLYQLIWSSLDWLYPPQCPGCGQAGERWCSNCQTKVSIPSTPICERCGDPISHPGWCADCTANPPTFQTLRSCGIFQGELREALHRLKYNRDISLGDSLSRHLIGLYLKNNWQVDLITAVPLSEKRLKDRGYNQASLLALPLALATGISYQPKALRRTRETRSQVGLSMEQRMTNVDGAFAAESGFVSGKNILVVDDVATTGATIEACARALQVAGAATIYGLTLARAANRRQPDDFPIQAVPV